MSDDYEYRGKYSRNRRDMPEWLRANTGDYKRISDFIEAQSVDMIKEITDSLLRRPTEQELLESITSSIKRMIEGRDDTPIRVATHDPEYGDADVWFEKMK